MYMVQHLNNRWCIYHVCFFECGVNVDCIYFLNQLPYLISI